MAISSRQLIRWSLLHERRARAGRWWTSSLAVALAAGAAIAGWVGWRAASGPVGASHAWLAITTVAFAFAFLRVPFLLYWRGDASLLAQLPIEGGPLFDAALVRCVRAGLATTLAALAGAAPLARDSLELAARHAAFAAALGVSAALLLPAVATWAAALVALGQRDDRLLRVRAAAGLAETPGPPSSALLGALPGFAGTIVLSLSLIVSPWLLGRATALPAPAVLASLAIAGVLSLLAARAVAPRVMGTILRDVSALDRQRLASLEIRRPTALERLIARALGDAALAYTKDARLIRRRYPLAFALGALAFLVLALVGVIRPDDALTWLTATLAGATVYALALAGRLHRPPIELPRLSSTLPIPPAARARAKLAWLLGWWTIFVALPATFAILRQPDPFPALALLAGATALVAAAGLAPRPA